MKIETIEELRRCKIGCLVETQTGTRYIKVGDGVTVRHGISTYNAGDNGWNWMGVEVNGLSGDGYVFSDGPVVLLFGELEPKVFEVGDEIPWNDALKLAPGSIVDIARRVDDTVKSTCVVGIDTICYAVGGGAARSTDSWEKLIVRFIYEPLEKS